MTTEPLGRGLSALLGEESENLLASSEVGKITYLSTKRLKSGSMQPRKHFDQEHLETLAASIREKGILQPLLARWSDAKNEVAEIIAGERRWRAANIAGLKEIPVIIVQYNDRECLEVGLVENLQRDDLNPIEEAEALKQLVHNHNRTQEEIAQAVGKSRSYVANAIRLLSLPFSVQEYVRTGTLSVGHARTLINHVNAEEIARKMVEKKMTVRDAEAIQKGRRREVSSDSQSEAEKNPDIVFLEQEMARITKMNVKLNTKHSGGGEIRLIFENMTQLDWLVRKLSN